VPDGRPGWKLTECSYCGKRCWKTDVEPDPLPDGLEAACTNCALKRGYSQREMDVERGSREMHQGPVGNNPQPLAELRRRAPAALVKVLGIEKRLLKLAGYSSPKMVPHWLADWPMTTERKP